MSPETTLRRRIHALDHLTALFDSRANNPGRTDAQRRSSRRAADQCRVHATAIRTVFARIYTQPLTAQIIPFPRRHNAEGGAA